MQRIEIYRLPTASPDDVSGLTALLDAGTVGPADIICVLGKTEGNGCVNDFSRGFATHAYTALLAARLGFTRSEVEARVQFIMSGGTEGVLTPHVTVFVKREVDGPTRPGKGLVAGIASTRRFLPEELGTMTQLRVVELAVMRSTPRRCGGRWLPWGVAGPVSSIGSRVSTPRPRLHPRAGSADAATP